MAKKKYYAVARGHKPGIYKEWYGENGAESQINGFAGALYKGFSSLKEAEVWFSEVRKSGLETGNWKLETGNSKAKKKSGAKKKKCENRCSKSETDQQDTKRVFIYTDGGCINNPGPGGYGVVLLYRKHRRELFGGFRRTTNNRMELMACIVGLNALKWKCSVTLYSDSKYVVNGIEKGWARRWRANLWMRNETEAAENADLWEQLLCRCQAHDVKFVWVKGHAGNRENECCDKLATLSASKKDLPPDEAYESGRTKVKPELFDET